ncbi:hypothetical protein [Lysobacter enzymogenes]|uniref:hypothetical protein n=1 Tax=Lysobacter enzymogenes TaxID=69 RepID=UPI0019D0E8C8|nr:hypothetical protein [Lysobacter enzymogenes]
MPKQLQHSPSVADILVATSQDDLKTRGSFSQIKKTLSSQFGITLAAKSWIALYSLIRKIQALSRKNPAGLPTSGSKEAQIVRKRLLTVLQRNAVAGSSSGDMDAAVLRTILTINSVAADPKVRYSINRSRNFRHSSRLEGIDVLMPVRNASLDSIIEKHRRK